MDELFPRSSGCIVDDGCANASLVNNRGVQYKVGKNVVWVWKTCQAKNSVQRLIQNYATTFNLPKEEAQTTVESILHVLEGIFLMDGLKNNTPCQTE